MDRTHSHYKVIQEDRHLKDVKDLIKRRQELINEQRSLLRHLKSMQAVDLGVGVKIGEVVELISEAAHMSRVMSQKLASSLDYYAG